jgi:hypothetical protein
LIQLKEKLEDGERVSKALIEFAPKSLRTIKFSKDDIQFSLNAFEALLKGWKERTSLSIITSNRVCENEEYMEIINKYRNNGMIENFECKIDKLGFKDT